MCYTKRSGRKVLGLGHMQIASWVLCKQGEQIMSGSLPGIDINSEEKYLAFFQTNFNALYLADDVNPDDGVNDNLDFARDWAAFEKEAKGYFGETEYGDLPTADVRVYWEAFLRGYDLFGYYSSGEDFLQEVFAGGLIISSLSDNIIEVSSLKIMILFRVMRSLREILDRIQETILSEFSIIEQKSVIAEAYTATMIHESKKLAVVEATDDDGQIDNMTFSARIEQIRNARTYSRDESKEWQSSSKSLVDVRSQQLDQIKKIYRDLASIISLIFR